MFKRNGASGGSRGGKKFGGTDFKSRSHGARDGGFGDKSFGKPQLHDAVCASCGNRCEVPFKPNGRKPIFCRECFKKEDDSQGERSNSAGYGRQKFAEKRMYAAAPAPRQNNAELEKRMDDMNIKLDRILREFEAMKERSA
jgi:CxxC-x17-CxxC domain-containing protein